MSLTISISGDNLVEKKKIAKIFLSYLPEKFCHKKVLCNIFFVNRTQITDLNNKYRHKNLATDVLSFPLNQDFQKTQSQETIFELGDLFICSEMAKIYNHEISFLIVHGFLHLIGLDHESLHGSQKWDKIEKKILSDINMLVTRKGVTI